MEIGSMVAPVAGSLAGLAIEVGMNDWRQREQYEQAEKFQGLEMKGSKEMSDYNANVQKNLALEMWDKTNLDAQRKQMEKAGLNVGLLYKGSGQGGVTASAPAGNVGSQKAEVPKGMGMELGLQMANAMAQIDLAKAQAEKARADAEKTRTVDTQETTTRIGKLVQETSNEVEKGIILNYDKQIKQVEANIANMSEGTILNKIEIEYNNAVEQLKQNAVKSKIAENTVNEQIEQMRQATIEQAAKIIAIKEGVKWDYGDTAQNARYIKIASEALGTLINPIKIR
jgi:hypothetical protein